MGACLSSPPPTQDEEEMEIQEIPSLLQSDESKLVEMYSKVPNAEAHMVAEALTVYFLHYNLGAKLLNFVVTAEAKAAANDGHLFLRTPTVGTRVIQQLFFICGGEEFVRKLLSSKLKKLVSENADFEINPEALQKRGLDQEKTDELQKKNFDALTAFVTDLLESLINLSDESKSDSAELNPLPEILYRICKCIREKVALHIPDYDAVYAASAFVFLRTICPAIISPVSNEHNYVLPEIKSLTPEVRRSLILTAKVIQNISTGSKREKEKWMTLTYDLNDKFHPQLRDFITVVSSKDIASEDIPVPENLQGVNSSYGILRKYTQETS